MKSLNKLIKESSIADLHQRIIADFIELIEQGDRKSWISDTVSTVLINIGFSLEREYPMKSKEYDKFVGGLLDGLKQAESNIKEGRDNFDPKEY